MTAARSGCATTLELVTLPAEQACFVSVDPTELDQAMLNLTVNARDAMPSAGRLAISTGVATRADSSYSFLRVADTGSGIDPEIVPRLFEPFFTTDRSETILLIEDDDAVREIAVRVLTRAGYTVVEARYGSEALDLAAEHPDIDLVQQDAA